MKVEYRKKFLKDLSRIPTKIRLKIENFVFEELPKSNTIFASGIIEQMKGYPSYYKAIFGSYRVGLKVENEIIIFGRVLHRKDIYRFFP